MMGWPCRRYLDFSEDARTAPHGVRRITELATYCTRTSTYIIIMYNPPPTVDLLPKKLDNTRQTKTKIRICSQHAILGSLVTT
jgi:hypothetical protein